MAVMPTPRISDAWLVVPLFNEASVIGDVVRGARERFEHVVCVDDGSTDGSGDAARAAGARVLRHPINLGQGASLQTGLDYAVGAGATYVVTFDADGQHRVDDAAAMVERARHEDLAIVFGSRFLDDRTDAGLLKKIVLKVAVWSIPLPWIAAELGWIVAEVGRQPWVIEGVLPTAVAVSNLGASTVLLTIAGFVAIYTVLLVIEMKLMLKAIRKGPDDHAPARVEGRPAASADLAPAQ